MEWLGIRWVGINPENGQKLLLTLALLAIMLVIGYVARLVANRVFDAERQARVRFWSRQAISVVVTVVTLLGLLSIWLDNPARLTTAAGLATAGLAFALQKVITSFAGYVVILRGRTFTVGDRITMGGVRGDVIALGFMQTTIMEMGQPPSVQSADPAMWVKSRQFTGRIVTVANSRIFDEPVYNYTREFPFIWEEMTLPVGYKADRKHAEHILLDAATRHAVRAEDIGENVRRHLRERYFIDLKDFTPRVFVRLTDNWIEMTVRFLVPDHGVRERKDSMARDVLAALEQAGIGVASTTYEIVGMPPLRVEGLAALDGAGRNVTRLQR
jgi:small-conductance mechanosensitive channel